LERSRKSGSFFACEQADIWPDFLLLSKGISGGYLPLSIVLTTDSVFAAFYDDDTARGFLHSHSYTGNPLACRAALATLDIFAQDDVIAANLRKAARLGDAFRRAVGSHPQVRHLRQQGMILAFDVADAPVGFSRRFFAEALSRELLLRPIGNTVYTMPPYILSDDEIDFLASRCAAALEASLG